MVRSKLLSRVVLASSLLAGLGPRGAAAESIWERAKHGSRTEEREVQSAIERVLLGLGDERDLMRVRVALITLARGEVQSPSAVVWLVRLRREMGLMPATVSDRLLRTALLGTLSSTERGWAHVERAHLALRKNDLGRAEAYLSTALAFTWRAADRAEVYVLRGFVHLRAEADEAALADFAAATRLEPPRRIAVQAHLGSAMTYAARGDRFRLDEAALAAYLVEAGRASVSRLDAVWDLALGPYELNAARAVLLRGKSLALVGTNAEVATAAQRAACLLLERPPVPPSAEEPEGLAEVSAWGSATIVGLGLAWGEDCATSRRLEQEREKASESAEAEQAHEPEN